MDRDLLTTLVEEAFAQCGSAVPVADCPLGSPREIGRCNDCLREAYYDANRPDVDYTCERRRWLYMVRYFAPNAWDIYHLLQECRHGMQPLLAALHDQGEGTLRVASVGCGPGSDLVGFVEWWRCAGRQLLGEAAPAQLSLLGVDRQPFWQPLFDRHVRRWTAGRMAEVTAGFAQPGPLWETLEGFTPHVTLCSWFWSEFGDGEEAMAVWERIADGLPRPCLVVFVDRTEGRVDALLDYLVQRTPAEVEQLLEPDDRFRNRYLDLRFAPEVEALLPKKNIESTCRVLVLS